MLSALSGIRVSHCRSYYPNISSNRALRPHCLSWNRTNRPQDSRSGPFGDIEERNRIEILEIELDKDLTPVYEPGQEVTGRLVLFCNGSVRFKSLAVAMKGIARVHWTETKAGNIHSAYKEHYSAEMEYFNKKRYLVSACSNGDRHMFTEGRHEFEFRFQLPMSDEISTSFEGRFGSVRYFIKAELDQSWAFTHKAKRAFTVISPIDINTEEQLSPVARESEKTVCCWLLSSGEVSMAATTDRKGYCPGESVAIDASFNNGSSRRIQPKAVLYQTQVFTAGGKSRTRRTKYTSLAGKSICGGGEDAWDSLLLKIPPVTPSITNCKLIRVEYFVKVSLLIPASYSLTVILPITIGTVPYRRARTCPTIPRPRFLNEPPPPYTESNYSSRIPRDPPPSYMECLEAEVDLVEAGDFSQTSSLHGDTRFAPLYRYVTDYRYHRNPPKYSELDPYPTQGLTARTNS